MRIHGDSCTLRDMSKSKRVQKPKAVRNEPYMRAMQELRKSNAAGTHKSKKSYKRKGKYGGWE